MEAIDALHLANAEVEARMRAITTDQWSLPTPCDEWDVRALVNHLLLGTRMSVHVLDGMPRDEVISHLDDDLVSGVHDPAATFSDLAEQMTSRFAAPGGLDGIVAHPAGDFPREVFIGFRVVDGAAHSWDLATATGADGTLDAGLVEWLWNDLAPRADMVVASGMFGSGASGILGDDVPLQTRLLDLLGRRPA